MSDIPDEPQEHTEQLLIQGETALTDDLRYSRTLNEVIELLEAGRQAAARSVNSIMTISYWKIGWRIVESEQQGEERAAYGESIIKRLWSTAPTIAKSGHKAESFIDVGIQSFRSSPSKKVLTNGQRSAIAAGFCFCHILLAQSITNTLRQ